MRYRVQSLAVAMIWLAISALTVLAFAGMISPEMIDNDQIKVALQQSISGTVNTEYSVTLTPGDSVEELQISMSLDSSNRNAMVGSLQLPGNLESIYIDKNKGLAYLANSFSGLQIIDINDPEHLRIRGSLSTMGRAWDIKVHDDILFLASADDGLHIVDISSVETPSIISHLKFKKHFILKLAIANQTVYATTGKGGLLVIDVADINAPRLVKTLYSDEGAWGLSSDKNRLYVSCGKYRLEALDISKPTNPQKIGELDLPDMVWDLGIREDLLYLPTKKAGLLIADMSTPSAPELLQSSINLIRPNSIELQHDRAYISSRTGSLSIVDLSNPEAPKLTGTYDIPGHPRNIAVSNKIAFVASGINGLQAFDTDKLDPATQINKLRVPGNLKKILFDDNFFYLATKRNGLYVAERKPSGEPGAIIAQLPLAGQIENMVRIENHLFIASAYSGLQVVDISNPQAPRIASLLYAARDIRDIVALGNLVLLADDKQGLLIVDVTFPDNPVLIDQFQLHNLLRLAIDDTYVYAATAQTGLHILDHSNPESLIQIGNLPLPWPLQEFVDIKRLAAIEDTVYMAAGPAGLIVFDISNRTSPRLREIISLDGEPLTVTVESNRVLASTRQGRLWILHRDFDNSTTRRAVIDTLGTGHDIILDGNRAIVANGIKGMTLLPLPQPLETSSRAGRMTLRIPPQSTPGDYNITLLDQESLIEIIGAVKLKETTE